MGYFDEMKKGMAEEQRTTGEAFAFDNAAGPFSGSVSDDDPAVVFAVLGKQVARALVVDATPEQFAKVSCNPKLAKRFLYEGKSYVIRNAFQVAAQGWWRIEVYLPS